MSNFQAFHENTWRYAAQFAKDTGAVIIGGSDETVAREYQKYTGYLRISPYTIPIASIPSNRFVVFPPRELSNWVARQQPRLVRLEEVNDKFMAFTYKLHGNLLLRFMLWCFRIRIPAALERSITY